ncbi:MAG: META domain-containing protein [Dehalococcoidales bacterium]|nr:MAG: META domain-containing protein [Dehalococcoidales bacterium]
MLIRRLFFGLLLLSLVTLSTGACTTTDDAAADLEDKDWLLESLGEKGNPRAVLEGTTVTARFDSAGHRVQGSAGCNSYFGDYEVDGNDISFSGVGNTEMYCMEPEGVMDQETDYLTILRDSQSFEVADGKLEITAGDQVLVFQED